MLKYINYPAKRSNQPDSRGKIDQDVNNHCDTFPNQYYNKRDIVNSVHESTHYANSSIRNSNNNRGGFYLLNDKATLLDNLPNITLKNISEAIPAELRGISFSLYLIQSQSSWQSYPIYLFDELSAYLNGTEAGIENKLDCWSELLQSFEFCLYTSVLSHISKDEGCREFQKYCIERAFNLYNSFSGSKSQINAYLEKWKKNEEYKSYMNSALKSYGSNSFL